MSVNLKPKSSKKGIAKAKFNTQDDLRLQQIIGEHGDQNWKLIASLMPGRTPRQCRERWENYINPSLNKNPWTDEEDRLLEEKFQELGPKWQIIVTFFNGRSKNGIKNRWSNMQKHQEPETTVQTHSYESPKREVIEKEWSDSSLFAIFEKPVNEMNLTWVSSLEQNIEVGNIPIMEF